MVHRGTRPPGYACDVVTEVDVEVEGFFESPETSVMRKVEEGAIGPRPADSEEARWLALEQASEARRQARAKLAPATTPAVSEPEQEPDTASREQRRQKRGPPKSGNGVPDVPTAP